MQTPGTPRRWRGWRWIARGALIFACVIAVALVAVVSAVHTDWGREQVRRQVERQLANTFIGGATLGKLEGSPFGELTLRDLVIRGPDKRPVISAGTVTVELALLPLISQQARVSAVRAEDVDVQLVRDASGALTITKLTRPGPKSQWSIALPDVQVRRAHVVLDTGSELVNLDGLSLDVSAAMPYGGPVDARIDARGTWRERQAAPLVVQAVVHSDDRGTTVPSLALHAGDVRLTGNHVVIGNRGRGLAPSIGGTLSIDAGAAAVARLVPSLVLPADVALTVTATPVPGQPVTQVAIAGRFGATEVAFTGTADLDARHARGELSTGAVDLGQVSSGAVTGTAGAEVAFDVRLGAAGALPVANATVRGWATLAGVPTTTFDISVSSSGERAHAEVRAAGTGVRGALIADVRVADKLIAIEHATLRLTTSDPARASGGAAPLRGRLNVDLTARGQLRPAPSIALSGTIDGRRLRMNDLSVASLRIALDAKRLPDRPYGAARVELVDIVRGDMQLGALNLTATDRADGKIAVSMRSRPKQNPWLIELDALVTPPGEVRDAAGPVSRDRQGDVPEVVPQVAIDLLRHHVRAGSGEDWTGNTGRIEIGAQRIAVRDLVTSSKGSRVAVAVSYERAGPRRGDFAANLDARAVALDNIAGIYHGKLDGRVALSRRRGVWQGDVALDATGVSIDPSTVPAAVPEKVKAEVAAALPAPTASEARPPAARPGEGTSGRPARTQPVMLDGKVRGSLRDGKLALTTDVTSAGVGRAALAIEIDPPRVISDGAAWQRLDRRAIRTAELTLAGIDVGRAAQAVGATGRYGGRIDGALRLSAGAVGGKITATNLVAPALRGVRGLGVVLDVAQPSPDELAPTLTVSVAQVGAVTARAALAVPERMFDPRAWSALGPRVLRRASVRADDIVIDPAMLDRFGVLAEYRGKLSCALEITEAARRISGRIDLAGLRGKPIIEPIDVRLVAETDERDTTSVVTIKTGGASLAELQARIPISLRQLVQRWRADPAGARATPLAATVKLAATDAARLLRVLGRTQITGGRIDGTVELRGTLGEPKLATRLVATGLVVPPGPGGKPVRTVERLNVVGSWDGKAATLEVDGVESDGGSLKISGAVNPDALRDGKLMIKARKLDLVPLLVFLPGPAGGAAGTLDANLTIQGLDLRTARLAGELHLVDARVPIAPTVGTLRRAKIDAVIGEREIKLAIDGRLGSGTVKLDGAVALDGAAPSGGKATLTLRNVSPIGSVEPKVSADVTATLARNNNQWRADLVVDNGFVLVPDDRGERLKPVGVPSDMRFANGERVTRRPMDRTPPENPIFLVTVWLRSTRVESDEVRGLVKGRIEMRADGEAFAVLGGIEADRGDLDLFGHRYQVERAGVHFDGPLDPLLDVRITHDFSDVTTITEVRGRLSNPELTLSSDPGIYSQGELLGFLLGGEPGGEPNSGTATDRVTSAGTSFIANRLGGYVRDALPIDIDVLRYEAATAATSAAVLVGTWITDSLFVAYRQHLEWRADQNTGEGEIEYWLSRRVVLEGVVGNRGFNGLDLLWRKRY